MTSEPIERLLHITAAMSDWLDESEYDHSHGNPNVSMNEPCDACTVKAMSDEAEAAIKAVDAARAQTGRDDERYRDAGDALAGMVRYYLSNLDTSDAHPDDLAAALADWDRARGILREGTT